ncbi:LacI family DNA-binding transcriptional regulator [Chitinimonas koreensis]|uniref:LacI family DNA-binding transcriptional regulator n=1 Tax=Chitinimonas koreensis TaxID=356302 RepID=UPI0003FFC4DC|nr:LacI family DNA-binding transcriptional regulator [Chitinimonas koreensis]QNM97670.1 LacI family DNA-binding transcriptional regulator [Chitinimonas koreensis]
MAESNATIYDIAQKAGVSVMTVSRALNGTGYVAEKTRAKVQAAAQELGYSPNLSAKVLNGSRTKVLGLLVSDIQAQAMTAIIGAIGRAAKEAGQDLLVYTTAQVGGEQPTAPDVMRVLGGICDGILMVMPGTSEQTLADMERGSLPVVLVNYWRTDTALPVVRGDNYQGSRAAVSQLAALGHRRIAFISGSPHSGQSQERQRGYRDALAAAGLAFDPSLLIEGDFAQSTGFAATRALLARPQRPTAIFAANDEMAFGAMDAIKAHGLRIPEDISVVGFDDIPSASHAHPRLTTVRQPLDAIGEAAVKLLLQRAAGDRQGASRIEFPSSLVLRDSTGPAPAAADHPTSALAEPGQG